MTAQTLVPVLFGSSGRTGLLSLSTSAEMDQGFRPGPCMNMEEFHCPVPEGEMGFLSTAKLAYRVALNRYGLSAGLSIQWCFLPCSGASFNGFEGGSAGAAFLLALIKLRLGEFEPRALRRQGGVADEIAAVRLEWVAASAAIDAEGYFCSVDKDGLRRKLQGLVDEQTRSGVRLAVISRQQTHIGSCRVDNMPVLFEFRDGLAQPFPILRAQNAEECYGELLRLQAEQVLL